MLRRFARATLCLALTVTSIAFGANPPEVDRALAWLAPQAQADGSVTGETSSIATAFQARSETLVALGQLATAPSALANSVAGETEDSTEYIARKIIALAPLGQDVSVSLANLISLQNDDGGFGGASGYQSNALDTAFALIALKASGSNNSVIAGRAITALTSLQGTDGSFGINDQPSGYITSIALLAMARYSQSYALGSAVTSAKGYLVSLQTAGAYGTTLDNSLGALALAATSTDNTSYAAAQQALRASQLADGSWADDPYLTSLALRALAASATGSPPSTNGQVSGVVIEDGGGAIAGAEIDLIGPQVLQGSSASDGTFLVTGVPPGTYSVKVSKPGYSTVTTTFTVSAGIGTNLGTFLLALGGSSATGLQGTVSNGLTGLPVAGATVSIGSGGSTQTDASGNYRIVGALAGPYTVTVSLSGFDTVTSAGAFSSGTIVLFSPALYPSGQTPNAATMTGSVVSTGGTAIAGATVTVNGATATTNSSGAFTLSGLTAGATSVSVSATGYVTRSYTVTLAAGNNSVGALAIAPMGSTITISGTVTDRASGLPVAAATILVQGTSLAATTGVSGTYQISGVSTPQFTLQVSAAGFVVKTLGVTLTQLVDSTVNIVLDKASSGGFTVQSIVTDRPAYDAFNKIEIETEVANSTANTPTLWFSAAVFDSGGALHMQTFPIPIVMQANGVTDVELETHNTNDPPGTYTVVVQGVDADGAVQVQGSTTFVINAIVTMSGGIVLSPPITQVGASPVTVNASLFDHGNIPMPGGDVLLTITVDSVDANYNPVAQASGGTLVASGAPFSQFHGGVFDPSGVLWILNFGTNSILSMAQDNTVSTFLNLATLPTPMTDAVDITRDSAGNLYVVGTNNFILKIAPDKTVKQLRTGIGNQKSVTVDANGNIWVAALGSTPVYSIDPVNGTASPYLGQGFSQPRDIAAGADGSLYVTNTSSNSISKVSPAGAVTTFVTGLSSPQGIEIDSAGNLYVANSGTNSVLVIAPNGTIVAQPYVSGVASPSAVRFDPQGNLFVSSVGSSTTPPAIYKVPAGGGAAQIFAKSVVPTPQGLAYDSQGALYVVGQKGDLARIDPSGAFSSYTPAPSGAFGLAIGPGDKPFVSVGGSGNIIRYDSPNTQFTYSGTGLGGSQGIVWNGGSLLYVAERSVNRISSLDINSGTRQTIADTIVLSANDISFASNGDRYILNNNRIDHVSGNSSTLFASSGFSASSFVAAGTGGFYLQESFTVRVMGSDGSVTRSVSMPNSLATGIAIDTTGAILVGEFGNRVIRRVNPATGAIDAAAFADLSTAIPSSENMVAINGDGSGGLFALSNAGKVVRVPSTGGNPSLLGTVPQSDGPQRIAYDPVGNMAYVKMNASIYAFNVATGTATKIVSGVGSAGGIEFANGLVQAGYGGTNEFVSYTTVGVEVDTLAGLSSPMYVTWDGTRIIVVDNSKTVSIVPGQLPKTLARDTAQFVTYSGGTLYGTKGSTVVTLDPSSLTYQTYFSAVAASSDNFALPFGVAVRGSDGALTFACQLDSRVETLSASRQVLASYAGIGQVTALATDASGNVYAASSDFSQLIRIPAAGLPTTVFAASVVINGLRVVNGTLYGSHANALIPFNSNGTENPGIQTIDSGAGLTGIAAIGSTLYAVDANELSVRVLQQPANLLATFASGVTAVTSLRAGPDGALYVGNTAGSVVRAAGGVLSPIGRDLGSIASLSFLTDGHLLAANTSGEVTAFDPGTFRQTTLLDMHVQLGIAQPPVWFVAADYAGGFTVGASPGGIYGLYRFGYTPAPALPAIGSVVGTPQRVTIPAIPVGTDGIAAPFATFTPPFGGDFRFTITRADGTTGAAVNTLHVGPSASGTMTVAQPTVAAGTATVHVSTRVIGADNTSIAKIDPARMQKFVLNGSSELFTLGGDPGGDILFGHQDINRITPQGVQGPAWTDLIGTIARMGGTFPVDSAGYVYVAGNQGVTNYIYRLQLNPGASATVVKSLAFPDPLAGLAIDSTGAIWALGTDSTGHSSIYVVHMDDPVTPYQKLNLSTSFTGAFAITVDGRDNIYVETNNGFILKINRDGTVSNLVPPDTLGDPSFENEGTHIAGDCANNIFIDPLKWRAYGQGTTSTDIEEHVLVQLVGSTGKVAQVIDGWQISPDLQDFDGIGYDKFSNSLLIYNELFFTSGRPQTIFRIPVTCGAINADLHVILAQGQSAAGFSPPPASTIGNSDGTQELIWHLADADVSGQSVSFDTTLQALTYGEKRPVAQSAYVALQNSFASGMIQVPMTIPSVSVDPQIDVAAAVDKQSYMANDDVSGTVTLTNRDVASRTVQLDVTVSDAQGVEVVSLFSGPVTLAPGQVLVVPAPYNVGTLLVGGYRMQAQVSDATSGAPLAADTAVFNIVASGTTLIASVSADKIAYDPLDLVTLSARVSNVSPNVITSGVSVTLTLVNSANLPVFTQTKTVVSLTPGAFQDAVFQYRLLAADIGQFTANLTVSDPTVTPRSTTFAVRSSADTGTGLRGAVLANTPVSSGSAVMIRASISNSGNAAVTNMPVTIVVVNPANGQPIATFTAPATVAKGGAAEVDYTWDTTGVAAGTYIAAASGAFMGRTIALGQTNIVVGTVQPFSFAAVSKVPLNTPVQSNTVTLAGIVAPATISVLGGQYVVNGGTPTSNAGTVNAGDKVSVLLMSASAEGATTTANLTVAGFTAPFSVTTAHITPTAFSFTALSNVPPSSVQTSNTVTIQGIDVPVPISIQGGLYSINNGPFTLVAGTVNAGDTVAVQVTASPTSGGTAAATLTVSTLSRAFSVTTTAVATGPNPFTFTPQTNVAAGTVVTSNTVAITGLGAPAQISITVGTYSINGGPFTASAGTIANNATVAVRLTSSATLGATVTATLMIGGVSGTFSVTTQTASTNVNPFLFTSQTNVPLNTAIISNTQAITGINTPVNIAVTSGLYNVNGGAFTAASGTVNNNDVVSMKVTSSGSYSTPATGQLTVSLFSTGFTVTTIPRPDPTVASMFSNAARVLALVSCHNTQGAEDYACESQRRASLDSYLTSLGIEHRVVTDTETFRSELRCGRWNTYWISGGAAKLKDTLIEEIREAVALGDALVVDGARDSSSASLDPIVGQAYVGTATESATVTLTGTIEPVGSFSDAGGAYKVSVSGGTSQGHFGTGTGDPAIITHSYGNGRAISFAFDLVGTLIAQPTSATLQAVVDQSLGWLAEVPAGHFTGDQYVAVVTTPTNPAVISQEVQVIATLPSGATFNASTPAPQSTTASTVTWLVTLAPNQSVPITWSLRTPQATGTDSISFAGTRIDSTGSYSIGTTTLGFDVTVLGDEATQATNALNALALTANADKNARNAAANDVLAGQTKAGQGLYADAIGQYLAAVDSLLTITSVSTATPRADIDKLLQEASRDWCRGGTACVPGTATGSAYSLMVFGSASLSNGSSTGSVGVGGTASLSSYTVASNLSGNAARFVGGSTLSWNNGSVGIGGSGVIDVAGTNTVNSNVGRAELVTTAIENWSSIQTDQLARADRYAAMSGTAATTSSGGAVNCTGTDPAWNVCTITTSQLNSVRSINLTYPAAANVLVNITGSSQINFSSGQNNFNGQPLQGSASAHQVIFNAAQVGSLTLNSWGWGGTLLAPRATVSQNSSSIDGQAVFNSLSTNSASYRCSGIFDGATP